MRSGEEYLSIYLRCSTEKDTSNWSRAAHATIKLFSFDDTVEAVKSCINPYVFESNNFAAGQSRFILWRDLFDSKMQYVHNNNIKLSITIAMDDCDEMVKSTVRLDEMYWCCDEYGGHATLRLIVNNISNLMAARSPTFRLQGIFWSLSVFRSQMNQLGIILETNYLSEQFACRMVMSAKLIPVEKECEPLERVQTKVLRNTNFLMIQDLVEWNLLSSARGYVLNDSIKIEIKLSAEKRKSIIFRNQ